MSSTFHCTPLRHPPLPPNQDTLQSLITESFSATVNVHLQNHSSFWTNTRILWPWHLVHRSMNCRRRQWQPTPVRLPGNSHGWRNLVGCSAWGLEESDMTEQLHFHFHALEKEMATHSSVLAWRIPETEEPGRLLSMGSHSQTRLKRLSSSSSSNWK